MSRVLLNHGLGNLRPETHWMYRLAIALRKAGHQVGYPQFPSPDAPVFADWQNLLIAETKLLDALGEDSGALIFIGHSLGALNYLQACVDGVLPTRFDRVLLVAPADPELLPDLPVGGLNPADPATRKAILDSTDSLTIVASDQDQWLPRGIQATFTDDLGLSPVIVPGARHFSAGDGWGPWAGVIDWVLNPTADLSVR